MKNLKQEWRTLSLGTLVLLISATPGGAVASTSYPACSSVAADSDGDGWGWENYASCRVVATLDNSSGYPSCTSSNSDGDGDGWGWENGTSCKVTSTKSGYPDCSNGSSDADGDGWGWENGASCKVTSTKSGYPDCSDGSSDIDGDGWGWENGTSCKVTSTKSGYPDCSDGSSDIDGDGWGWENGTSCKVTSTKSGYPDCSNGSSDADGDGWGWENGASCKVTSTKSGYPDCSDGSSDIDGDGWGWENGTSCKVTSTKSDYPDCSAELLDVDGDGWGYENNASCRFVVSEPKAPDLKPKISNDEEFVKTQDGSNPFSKFQLDNTLYTNNVYDRRQWDDSNNGQLITYEGVQDFVSWEVPADGNGNACDRAQTESPVLLNYRLTSRKDSPTERNSFVRSFPALVVGTMGGRYESWGVECGLAEIIFPSINRHGSSPVFQMDTVANATGLPVKAGELDSDIRVSIKANLNTTQASTGIANLFMDSYWHNVSDVALIPGSQQEFVDSINGINSNFTEVWNLNIWFDYPRSLGSASSWTGGFKIGSVNLQEGGAFDVYFKIEGARDGHIPRCRLGESDNCFLYIGLVATDVSAASNGITVNYREIADWMRSSDFRDLFLVGAFKYDTPASKAYEAWSLIDGSENDNHPDPARRGPRFPDNAHVIGGIHLGAELWYNPLAEAATIEFEALGVEVEGIGQFGRFVNY